MKNRSFKKTKEKYDTCNLGLSKQLGYLRARWKNILQESINQLHKSNSAS